MSLNENPIHRSIRLEDRLEDEVNKTLFQFCTGLTLQVCHHPFTDKWFSRGINLVYQFEEALPLYLRQRLS